MSKKGRKEKRVCFRCGKKELKTPNEIRRNECDTCSEIVNEIVLKK